MKIRRFFLIACLFSSLDTFAQKKIFQVLDPNGNQPISGVIVSQFNVKDSLLNYTLSDRKGYVSIPDLANSSLLIRKIGFDSLRISLTDVREAVYLYKVTIELNEIIIKSDWQSMHSKSDTVKIVADSLRRQHVNTLEDLLGNIEGVNIDGAGKITYQNKAIDAVLVDGENLTLDNYQVLTKNISESLAEGIEIYTAYEDNPLLAEFRRTGKIAINIKTKQTIRVSGHLKAGLGWNNRHDHSGNMITLKSQLKTLSGIGYNTTGQYSFGEYFNLRGVTGLSIYEDSPVKLLGNIQPFSASSSLNLAGFQNLAESTELFANENLQVSGKKWGSLTNMYLSSIRQDLNLYEQLVLFQSVGSDTLFTNERATRFLPEKVGISNNSHFNFSERLRLETSLAFNFNKNRLSSRYSPLEDLSARNVGNNAFANLSLYFKLSPQKIIKAVYNQQYQKMEDRLDYSHSEGFYTPFEPNPLSQLKQLLNQSYDYHIYTLGYMQRFKKNIVLDLSLQQSHGHFKQDIDRFEAPFGGSSTHSFSSLGANVMKRLKAGLASGFLKTTFKNRSTSPIFTGNLAFEKNIRFSVLKLQANRDFISLNNFIWANGYFTNAYMQFQGTDVEDKIWQLPIQNSLMVSVLRFFPKIQFQLGGELNTSLGQQTVIQQWDSDKNYSLMRLENEIFNVYSHKAGLNLEKFIPQLSQVIKAGYNINRSQNRYYFSDVLIESTRISQEFKAYAGSAFQYFYNYRLNFSYRNNIFYRNNEGGSVRPIEVRLDNYLSFFDKKLVVTQSNMLFRVNTGQKINLLTNAEIKFKPAKKPLEFAIKGNNLLNQKTYSFLSENINTMYYAIYDLRPRTVIASVKWIL